MLCKSEALVKAKRKKAETGKVFDPETKGVLMRSNTTFPQVSLSISADLAVGHKGF